ncbi:hypothetical protein FisN_12Lh099 [Fistulifera solaris]|jgi:hypothetical protein|uniref:Uncharacterized protein n=1 Tax=Fistulifera solaris TaxID=1519565 RepID=A0A1Z5JMG2_FISSO|nr:hypothetical protein FisN_12Lh099 [Fistulifera solaris]|eukprot:GAX15197.1 hypothetical protein FisN_12Lh099 [Fistulifera solaris]
MNLESSFEQLSITEDAPPRRPHLVRLNAQREITCRDPTTTTPRRCDSKDEIVKASIPPDSIRDDDDNDDKTLETVFTRAQKRFPLPSRLSSRSQIGDEMSLASMGAQELEFYWQPNSTRSLNTNGSRRTLQRHATPPHLLRTLTLSSHRPQNPVAGLWRQSSLLTNDSSNAPPFFSSSRPSSTRTFASTDTL